MPIYYLEKYRKEDFDLYYQLVSDIKVMAMITEHEMKRDEAIDDFEKTLLNNDLNIDFGAFKVFEKESNTYIGFAKLSLEKKNDDTAEIGYMLLPEFWGKGIASQLVETLIEKAQEIKQLKSLWAIIDPKNIASRKALTRQGFSHYKMYEIDGFPGEVLAREI